MPGDDQRPERSVCGWPLLFDDRMSRRAVLRSPRFARSMYASPDQHANLVADAESDFDADAAAQWFGLHRCVRMCVRSMHGSHVLQSSLMS